MTEVGPTTAAGTLAARVADRYGPEIAAFGIRAEDFAEVLGAGCTGRFTTLLGDRTGESLEALTGGRVNPDLYDIDLDDRPEAADLVTLAVRRAAETGTGLLAYRPGWRIEAAAAAAGIPVIAMPVAAQRPLEDKPSVEAAVERLGIPTVGWSDPRQTTGDAPGPFVVRSAGQGGGAGMSLAATLADARSTPGAVGASRYVPDAVSLNLSGCCFADGTVSVHLPTVQLIGTEGCTDLPFGYCGNDAPALAGVPGAAAAEASRLVVEIGRWLADAHRWRGVFGIDVLATADEVLFCELNPRFQGSTRLASAQAIRSGRPGLVVEHLAAVAGLVPHPDEPIGTDGLGDESQIVVHNLAAVAVRAHRPIAVPDGWTVELHPDPAVAIEPSAPIVRLRTAGTVLTGEGTLRADAAEAVAAVHRAVAP